MTQSSYAASLKEYNRKKLIQVLDSIPGQKALILDAKVSAPLSLIAEFSLLKEHGVEKIYHLEKGPLSTTLNQWVYLCRPSLQKMKYIAGIALKWIMNVDHILAMQNNKEVTFNLFFVPRRSVVCERVLEEEGVYGQIKISDYPFDLVPLDDDLFSLELDLSFRQLFVENDITSLVYISRALIKLQTLMGFANRVVGRGENSKLIVESMQRMKNDLFPKHKPNINSVDTLIVIDRNVDLVTPFCTPLTYEGLVDEIFGIHNIDSHVIGENEPKKYPLNSSDLVFREIRDLHVSNVSSMLGLIAKQLKEGYNEYRQADDIQRLRQFVTKLGSMQNQKTSLALHIKLFEEINRQLSFSGYEYQLQMQHALLSGDSDKEVIDFIDELIDSRAPIESVWQMFILYCQTQNGMKKKNYESFKQEIIRAYGYEHLFTMTNLEKARLIFEQDGSRNHFPSLRKSFKLIMDNVDEKQPNDISYVFSGFAPFSVRLVQFILGHLVLTNSIAGQIKSIKLLDDALRYVPGPSFDSYSKEQGNSSLRETSILTGTSTPSSITFSAPKKVIVCFIGGCTWSEIASLRLLQQQDEGE